MDEMEMGESEFEALMQEEGEYEMMEGSEEGEQEVEESEAESEPKKQSAPVPSTPTLEFGEKTFKEL